MLIHTLLAFYIFFWSIFLQSRCLIYLRIIDLLLRLLGFQYFYVPLEQTYNITCQLLITKLMSTLLLWNTIELYSFALKHGGSTWIIDWEMDMGLYVHEFKRQSSQYYPPSFGIYLIYLCLLPLISAISFWVLVCWFFLNYPWKLRNCVWLPCLIDLNFQFSELKKGENSYTNATAWWIIASITVGKRRSMFEWCGKELQLIDSTNLLLHAKRKKDDQFDNNLLAYIMTKS